MRCLRFLDTLLFIFRNDFKLNPKAKAEALLKWA